MTCFLNDPCYFFGFTTVTRGYRASSFGAWYMTRSHFARALESR